MKAHLKTSAVPIADNVAIVAECGESVPNAKFVFMWDEVELCETPYLPRNVCRKCLGVVGFNGYLYGIVNGQEAKLVQGHAD